MLGVLVTSANWTNKEKNNRYLIGEERAQTNARFKQKSAKYSLIALATLLACSAFAQSNAQQNESGDLLAQVETLNPVVVTGSRTERNTKEIPATVNVIDEEELETKQIYDIREAVESIPNVEVPRSTNRISLTGSGGRKNNAGFNIRGLDGNRVLLLVDGVRAPRSYGFGGSSSRDNFDLGLIERIEVKKGPSSALYGSDGIGGVVQFFTPEPQRYIAPGDSFGGTAHVTYVSENNGWRLGGTLAKQFTPELSGLIGISHIAHHELKNKGDNNSPDATRTKPNPENSKGTGVLAKLVYEPSTRTKHTFSYEFVNKKTELNPLSDFGVVSRGVKRIGSEGSTENKRQRISWDAMFGIQAVIADTLRTKIAHQNYDSNEFYANARERGGAPVPGQVRDTNGQEDSWQLNVQAEKTIPTSFGGHILTYGLDYLQAESSTVQTGKTPPSGERFPLKRYPDTTEKSVGVYIQDEIVGDGWSITPAVRWDSFDIGVSQSGFPAKAVGKRGSKASPSIGGTVDLSDKWTLYGQWSTGYRTPSANQINRFFENLSSPFFGYKTIPNPDLKPETAKHTELGIKGGVGDKWRFNAAVFQGKYKDFIQDNKMVGGAGTRADPTVFQAVNVGRATISGFEIDGEYRFDTNSRGGVWSIPFAYGQADGKDDNTSKPIDSILPARTNIGVRYEEPRWMVGLDATHRAGKSASDANELIRAASRRSPAVYQFLPGSSTTLDLYGQWKFKRSNGKEVRLSAGIENLTDKKHWRWGDVIGVSSKSSILDAYTQPGRSFNIKLTADF